MVSRREPRYLAHAQTLFSPVGLPCMRMRLLSTVLVKLALLCFYHISKLLDITNYARIILVSLWFSFKEK